MPTKPPTSQGVLATNDLGVLTPSRPTGRRGVSAEGRRPDGLRFPHHPNNRHQMIFLLPATLNRHSRSTAIRAVSANPTARLRSPAPEAVGVLFLRRLGGLGSILLFAPLMYAQDVPLGGDALEEFPFPIVMSLSRQSLCLLGPVSAFIRSHGWTSQHWLAPSAIHPPHLILIGRRSL